MTLPDLPRLLICHHEAAHYVAALQLGIPVVSLAIKPVSDDDGGFGYSGGCRVRDEHVELRRRLLCLAVGAHAARFFFPELPEAAWESGRQDFDTIDRLVKNDRHEVFGAVHRAAEAFVREFEVEVGDVAMRLDRDGEIDVVAAAGPEAALRRPPVHASTS